jgi:radical SAM protein with 4Fe4S-binding SPASM domain
MPDDPGRRRLPVTSAAPVVVAEATIEPIPMFLMLEIETRSTCNRRCAACIRNAHPDRKAVQSWFEEHDLPLDVIFRVMLQVREMGCGAVGLQHYNEPLEDKRLPHIAAMAKGLGFASITLATNGDYMTPELAAELDDKFTQLDIAIYPTSQYPYKQLDGSGQGPTDATERESWLRSLFRQTKLNITRTLHCASHFSPLHPVEELAAQFAHLPCYEPIVRMIVNHRGDMLLCCQDVTGNFELGNVHEASVAELWNSDRHRAFVQALDKDGGRAVHPHCLACPQAGWPKRV